MWDETNFLVKGFINEVKGALTESGGASGGGSTFDTSASGRVPKYDHGYATTELSDVFETSAVGAVK